MLAHGLDGGRAPAGAVRSSRSAATASAAKPSIARWAAAGSGASAIIRINWLATTTPSAMRPTAATWAGVRMPKPTASGASMRARARSRKPRSSSPTCTSPPVTPVTDTQ